MPLASSADSQEMVATFCRGTTPGRPTSLCRLSIVSLVAKIVCAKAADKRSECPEAGDQTLQEGLPAIEEYCTEVHEATTWTKGLPQRPTAANL